MEENKQTDLEEVIEEVEQETPQVEEVEEVAEEQPEIDLTKFDSADDPDVIKVDLSNQNAEPVEETTEQESHISFNEDGDIKIDLAKFMSPSFCLICGSVLLFNF